MVGFYFNIGRIVLSMKLVDETFQGSGFRGESGCNIFENARIGPALVPN
jgi:hypothetical protein